MCWPSTIPAPLDGSKAWVAVDAPVFERILIVGPGSGAHTGGQKMGESLMERYANEVDEVRELRDELAVRLHLAKLEVKDQWEVLEKKWHHLEAKLKQIESAGEESAGDVSEAAQLFVGELREGYRKIRNLL
jgi:hypothetical protein